MNNMSSRSIFLAGVFISLLLFKPGFGLAVWNSVGLVAGAAFDNQAHAAVVPPVPPQPLAPVSTIDKGEEVVDAATERMDRFESRTEQILTAIASLLERMDRLESRGDVQSQPRPLVEEPSPQTLIKEGSDMDVSQFDKEFNQRRVQ